MEIKYDAVSVLIYAAMVLWLAAIGAYATSRRRAGEAGFAAGFVLLAVAFVARWVHVEHPPLQNLFEIFLTLGMLMYPLWRLGKRFLGVTTPIINAAIGWIVLFPAGLIFKSEPQMLPPALQSWLFVPHVGVYMLSYVVLIMAAAEALLCLLRRGRALEALEHEQAASNLIHFAFPMLTLGIVLGAVWGKLAWGDYWNWDPKELWSLTTFLAYIAYLHVRGAYGRKHMSANAILAIIGGLCVIITLLWVNLSRLFPGMHSYAT